LAGVGVPGAAGAIAAARDGVAAAAGAGCGVPAQRGGGAAGLTDAERALRLLRNEILEMGGTAQLLSAAALVGEADIIAAYNAARDEEYVEVIARCDDFLTEIDTETVKEHFTYAELEENDEDLTKLRGWLAKITTRDVLGAARRGDAEQALAEAEAALETFANRVYATETGVAVGEEDTGPNGVS
jgi:hypothetical protein